MSSTLSRDVEQAAPSSHTTTLNIYLEDDDYIVECIEFGTVGQGANLEEALADWVEANNIYLKRHPSVNTAFVDQPRTSLIDGVRELEQAYAERIGQPVDPANIHLIKTLALTLPHA